jgi:TRAP-type C4-dicarboxylate transport system substrate-binding protein
MHSKLLAATSALALLAFTGCDQPSTNKAGGDAAPVSITIGTPDPQGRPASDDVEEFARLLAAESDGALDPKIEWEAGIEDHPPQWDLKVIEMVRTGELDFAMVPARAFDELDVETLRALQTPLLIDSDEYMTAVARADFVPDMLAGLDAAGVTGLALLPETQRHLVSFGSPFLTPADVAGARIRAPLSRTSYAMISALGAEPVDLGKDFSAAVSAGVVGGAETSIATASTLPRSGVFTGNVPVYPKFNVFIANPDSLADLAGSTRDAVTRAAAKTVDYVLSTNPTAAEIAREYCDQGGVIALASPEQLGMFEEALQPFVKELTEDEVVGELVEKIRAVDPGSPGSDVPACGKAAPPPPPASTAVTADFPEGTYRHEVTAEFMMARGISADLAHDHAGLWTLTFEDGKLDMHDGCTGTYAVQGGRVSLLLGEDDACGTARNAELFSAGWTLEGDTLWLTEVRAGVDGPTFQTFHEALWGGLPWTKIK